jgi:maleylacetoacetate isomerase
VKELGGDSEEWIQALTSAGLAAYEATAKDTAGTYSVGDSVTMADVCLLPAVWNAQRFKVDLSKYPTVVRVAENLEKLPAAQKSSYFRQADTPEDLRDE